MENIQTKLQDIITSQVIPESEEYLKELHKLLEENKANEDDIEAIKEMESFLVELQNIVDAVDENKINQEQAKEIYEKIVAMIDGHDH